ncbi:dipeptide epimerase [Mucilaginibacter robiniae]|uniref:Dipeptide epimerase n=1 Tax=Mucilaginibacter robiniae TaxID=2728022 RepID=A0A7L5E7U8_9SPHI|nr:dipeptide epimerase [Mucilaginibacter robiniae]QJD96436.1 dipeptide epimerase [Mucilaginibacter robiniae]
MKLTFTRLELQLKHRFTIARFSRTSTPVILLQLEHEGFTGYGEASMVPYMGESFASATAFLNRVDVSQFQYPFNYTAITAYLDNLEPGNPAIKAAIDIALHDLDGKISQQSCWQLLGSQPDHMPVTSLTIGMDTPEVIAQKVQEAIGMKVIKVKLGSQNDQQLIKMIRQLTKVPLYVDANQGWIDRQQSLDFIYWLQEQNVQLIEQPMLKTDPDSNAWLTERSPIPIIGDEAVQRLADVERAQGIYHGINIKLMKSAGMHEAKLMIDQCRKMGLKILIGCMSETSCATLAAAALAPQCDWADLDGPFLISNNPFQTPGFENGKWILNRMPGLGLSI